MPISISDPATLRKALAAKAREEGLNIIGTGSAVLPEETANRLQHFLGEGRHGDMVWMEERATARSSPDALWPEARSAIVFALPYGQDLDPLSRLTQPSTGVISVYALNKDYHDVFKGKLKRIAQWFAQATAADVKVFVDTAPLMEKPLAQQAGIGWQGKHTNLVSRDAGSWFFLGSILTSLPLEHDAAEPDHCGSCRSCLDICPTKAFPAPYQLDARRCISYLTIEHKGMIAREFRKAMGNRIYGCDDCLAVCPWNKYAQAAADQRLSARVDLVAPPLAQLLRLDDAAFRQLFSGSPVKRTGRNRFIRNCLIAAGNSGDASLVPVVSLLLDDEAALVRAMAVWALKELDPGHCQAEWQARAPQETDADVIAEWAGTA